ncbi:MAG: peptidylprolyl isomerase [Bacteroidota bacterium]
MKKIYFLSFLLLSSSYIFSQTLFTYGTNVVTKDEFLRAYNKNKPQNVDKEQALKDYLDLYTKFKLKVKAAKELRLDTLQQLQTDIDGFRSQVEEGYMNDDKGVNDLVKEAFLRGQREIHTIHFYVPVTPDMSNEDSLKAYKLIEAAYNELVKGKSDYNDIAAELSAKNKMVLKSADLGYTTVFSVPYDYENIIYGLKPGAVSVPYRTKKAWHVFKNLDERRNMGKWRVAQILFAFPPNVTADIQNELKKRADSVYALLKAGADFGEMAKKYSQDKNTYMTGGELQEFSTGRYAPDFEAAVFALKNDGDISAPLQTAYGYHIIKRLKQTPIVADETDESYMFDLKQKVLKDGRINVAKEKFLNDVLAKLKYKRNALIKDEELYKYADSVIKNKKLAKYTINTKTVFSLEGKTYTGNAWLKYINDQAQSGSIITGESSKDMFKKYLSAIALNYYKKNLEKYNSDFKYQMQEFKEGNMLFEIMERKVWSKAANDSIGLKTFYSKNKTKYMWEESADAVIYNAGDIEAAQQAIKEINVGKSWRLIAEESNAMVQADSGRYEISQLPVTVKVTKGMTTVPTVNTDGTVSFVQIINLHPGNEQRTFDDARGMVINEYQNYLEDKWVETLKQKYPVKVNDAVFKSLLQ